MTDVGALIDSRGAPRIHRALRQASAPAAHLGRTVADRWTNSNPALADDARGAGRRRAPRPAPHGAPSGTPKRPVGGWGPTRFFPGRGESSDEARAICEGCAVRKDCLSAALAAGDSCWGVWGGLSNRGRRVLRRGVGLGRHFLVPQRWGNG